MHGPKDFVARETHQHALPNLQYDRSACFSNLTKFSEFILRFCLKTDDRF